MKNFTKNNYIFKNPAVICSFIYAYLLALFINYCIPGI